MSVFTSFEMAETDFLSASTMTGVTCPFGEDIATAISECSNSRTPSADQMAFARGTACKASASALMRKSLMESS